MALTRMEQFDRTLQKTNECINELGEELGADKDTTYYLLRALLHSIRDRLTVEEATQFAAQLPMLVKGFYYEGWRPSVVPVKSSSINEFFQLVKKRYGGNEEIDFDFAVPTVILYLSKKIFGETEDIKAIIPAELRTLWEVS